MSGSSRTTSDPWDDDWVPAGEISKSQTSGGVVVESKAQIRKLFAPDNLHPSQDDDSPPVHPVGPIKYEVQTNGQGSKYRPQLRILKRTPDSTNASALPTSTSRADGRTGETDSERRERARRDKEAKYRAVRESIFGAESGNSRGTSNASNSSISSDGGSSQSSRNKDRESKDQAPRDSRRRGTSSSTGRSSNGSTPSPARGVHSGTDSSGPTGKGGIIRVPKGPDGTPGFGRNTVLARKGQ
ncbi:hypothetical protein POJ06DRAFT_235682 [Lipomyces tetrasporus]|uniref:SUZ domain-containing protein n=1 Tax=Lipomyces tetrasporus TaxID=54092 RepID=A0AAD7QWE2_9ASCO|nr:uncharacterized protein POJ06DRAFT_235682 [Lipomyces tetrasporus]KAJ8102724.1 hypothetical protein POJ06DRAFT_235682 [Lipomyces tetrasporus]